LAGFAAEKDALDGVNARVVAASVDPLDKAEEVASEVNFPIAYGVDRALADEVGAFWDDKRQIVQPAEFLVRPDGKIVQSSYSSGPLGRTDAADVVKLIQFLEKR